MQREEFITKLQKSPESLEFTDTMAVIEANYIHQPTAFTNGTAVNTADQNQGSCKLLAFAQLQGFDQAQTLACFGRYYRDDVLGNPSGNDHQNIRQFMLNGWAGVIFAGSPLTIKNS